MKTNGNSYCFSFLRKIHVHIYAPYITLWRVKSKWKQMATPSSYPSWEKSHSHLWVCWLDVLEWTLNSGCAWPKMNTLLKVKFLHVIQFCDRKIFRSSAEKYFIRLQNKNILFICRKNILVENVPNSDLHTFLWAGCNTDLFWPI